MEIDWAEVFLPQTPVLEIIVRGSVMYLSMFALLRFVLRREAGTLGITDLLVIVLIADASQNAMAGDHRSIADGLVLVATILAWSHVLTVLAYRYPWWRKVVHPPRIQLVRDGRVVQKCLDREKITEDELMGELRAHGVDDVSRVQAAYLESDGMVSVITRSGDKAPSRKEKKRSPL